MDHSRREVFLELVRSRGPLVEPSMLMCDFGHLAQEVQRLEQAGVPALHLDVMDGHFVPNSTYGLLLVETFQRISRLPLDVHLMISNPEQYVERFIEAGAWTLTVHLEAVPEPSRVLQRIRRLDVAAGLALNPETPLEKLIPWLPHCDYVLVMTVSPGYGGQQLQHHALEKAVQLRREFPDLLIEVDGGIKQANAAEVARAGADMLAVGSAIFRHHDYGQAVAELEEQIRRGRTSEKGPC